MFWREVSKLFELCQQQVKTQSRGARQRGWTANSVKISTAVSLKRADVHTQGSPADFYGKVEQQQKQQSFPDTDHSRRQKITAVKKTSLSQSQTPIWVLFAWQVRRGGASTITC